MTLVVEGLLASLEHVPRGRAAARPGDLPRAGVAVKQLVVGSGDAVAVLGPSGSGKTTLLEVLGLVRRPWLLRRYQLQGRELAPAAIAGDIDTGARLRASCVGYVPQSGGVISFLNARDNALSGLVARGARITRAVERRLAEEADSLGLADALSRGRATLSGGERRRVGLLRALVDPRPLILVDEPTSALDPAAADGVFARLRSAARETDGAVLAVTHDRERAARHGFDLLELSGGAWRLLRAV
jgi:putative ABC transport system ATP-binding protein